MKEFYQVANKVLMIKRNHPVVTKVKRETESGETEIFEEKQLAEGAIGEYFANIYKRPGLMAINNLGDEQLEDTEMMEEQITTAAMFSLEDIKDAMKQSNFNKGLGPDCFDGNLLK